MTSPPRSRRSWTTSSTGTDPATCAPLARPLPAPAGPPARGGSARPGPSPARIWLPFLAVGDMPPIPRTITHHRPPPAYRRPARGRLGSPVGDMPPVPRTIAHHRRPAPTRTRPGTASHHAWSICRRSRGQSPTTARPRRPMPGSGHAWAICRRSRGQSPTTRPAHASPGPPPPVTRGRFPRSPQRQASPRIPRIPAIPRRPSHPAAPAPPSFRPQTDNYANDMR